MTNLLRKAIGRLEQMSKEAQNTWASRILEGLASKDESRTIRIGRPYSSLSVLRDARLKGPRDASVTYEEELYGLGRDNDE